MESELLSDREESDRITERHQVAEVKTERRKRLVMEVI